MPEPLISPTATPDKAAPSAQLRIALAIYRLSPVGGLEDNCIRIAKELERRGHDVTIFTASEAPGLPLSLVRLPRATSCLTNHRGMTVFAADVQAAISGRFDRTVAFQTMPGTDIVFLADTIKNKPGSPLWKRVTPRFRAFARMESACFGPESPTRIIGLTEPQMQPFIEQYGTAPSRISIAPATLSRAKCKPDSRNPANRSAMRAKLGLASDSKVWLWLGLAPKTKGLDRVIEALSISPGTHVLIGGLSSEDKNMLPMLRLARRLGVEDRLHCLGYLSGDALFEAMAASDALAHPARTEVTGGVILEAIINGLPVVVTDICGFARHVRESGAGEVIARPFRPRTFARLMQDTCGPRNSENSSNGIRYGNRADLFCGIEKVADLIEAETWDTSQTLGASMTFSKNSLAD